METSAKSLSKIRFLRLLEEEKLLEIDRFTNVLYSKINLDTEELIEQTKRNYRELLKKVGNDEKRIIRKIHHEMSIETWLSEENSNFIPKRLQVILFCFLVKADYTLANQLLTSCGHGKLNARSILDATIIYSLKMKHSFDQWAQLFEVADSKYKEYIQNSEKREYDLTISSLRSYVESQKRLLNGQIITFSPTEELNNNIQNQHTSRDFLNLLINNFNLMSEYRVKTRLRIVEALLDYIDKQVIDFVTAYNNYLLNENSFNEKRLKKIYDQLVIIGRLKNGVFLSNVVDKKCLPIINDVMIFDSLSIVSSKVCDSYTNFYHQANLLNVDRIKDIKEKELLAKISKETKNVVDHEKDKSINSKEENASANVTEIDNNEVYDFEEGITKNLTNRYVNKDFENMLLGYMDANRKFFISFLIFTGNKDIQSLNSKLINCGFDLLSQDRLSDCFFQEFINCEDKLEFLYEVAAILLKREEPYLLENISDCLTSEIMEVRKKLSF